MRKLTLILFLALAALLAACSGSQPQINPETSEFDFGDVVNGVIMEKDLTVRNTGKADLVVDMVTTTCGCTTANLDSMTIPAGESTTLHIEFDSGAHGPDLTGQVMRQVILVSNDPEQPESTVQFVANILPPESP
ncbi:MAG: DUF1573 domain-containing protein [Anaerolineales bacterium]|nr:DUF1573 domain-containing protein [Anaerolineales bacterium]